MKIIILKYKEEAFLSVIYLVGIVGHSVSSLLPLMKVLTPYTLLISVVLISMKLFRFDSLNVFYWGLVTFLITYLTEVIGVKTGLIFGDYSYGNVLGIKLFDVPIIIGLNWVFVILGLINLFQKLKTNNFFKGLCVGIGAVAFDFILEPVAISLTYWNWDDIQIPLQNYIAWFVLAYVFYLLFAYFKIDLRTTISRNYFIIQTIFFIVLRVGVL